MNDSTVREPAADLRERFRTFLLHGIAVQLAAASPEERLDWRISRYDNGLKLVEFARRLGLSIRGDRVLDSGCAYGGDILPFAAAGAEAFGSDYLDHDFAALRHFASREELPLVVFPADAIRMPVPGDAFDLVISLDVIEHLPRDDLFAIELARVLKPGGIALITTPARWKFLRRDPHFGVPFLHALPMPLRLPVAKYVFRRDYPYPIYRIYASLGEVARPFEAAGLTVDAATPWSPRAERLEPRLPARVFRALQERFWEILVVRKPR